MGYDHSKISRVMEEIAISKFKARCLAVLERVRRTRKPVRVTRFGQPVAEVMPPSTTSQPSKDWLGCMAGTAVIAGDIVAPVSDEEDWDALRK